MNFAIVGAAGYIAPRHMRAIRDTGHRLVSACDPHDAVGVLDTFAPEADFFTDAEAFWRVLHARRRDGGAARIDAVAICSPNDIHAHHVARALQAGADAICEKPLVLDPAHLDLLQEMESETGRRVYTVLQLRLHPELLTLRAWLQQMNQRQDVEVDYITPRGPWYDVSWKGDAQRSGGIVTNIGIHVFDLLLWLFGPVRSSVVTQLDPHRAAGVLDLAMADVCWRLSTDRSDLPSGRPSYRCLRIGAAAVEFSDGFGDLHTRVYQDILAGRGCGIEDARSSIELVHQIRHARIASAVCA